MSELKAYTYDDMIDGDADTNIEYYPKSEADKVITKLKEKLVEQTTLRVWAEIQLRHNKYKRCLAMAKWCESKVYHIRRTPLCDMSEHKYWQYENDFWQRWQKRWPELAEKFKEMK